MVRSQISISLDGFAAGPNQSTEHPLGEGGMRLHDWVFATHAWNEQHGREGGERNADSEVVEKASAGIGAHIMGRHMFGGWDGPWDEDWRGWWDEDPPFHAPVFVLTHHPRDELQMEGGTTFTFFGSLLAGLLMGLALYAGARWATARDPQLLRIVLRSASARSRYDPAKRVDRQ